MLLLTYSTNKSYWKFLHLPLISLFAIHFLENYGIYSRHYKIVSKNQQFFRLRLSHLLLLTYTDVLLSIGRTWIKTFSANYLPSIFWQIWRENWYYSTCICKLARSKHIVVLMFFVQNRTTGILFLTSLWTNGSLVLLTAPEITSANNRRFYIFCL